MLGLLHAAARFAGCGPIYYVSWGLRPRLYASRPLRGLKAAVRLAESKLFPSPSRTQDASPASPSQNCSPPLREHKSPRPPRRVKTVPLPFADSRRLARLAESKLFPSP